MKPTLRRLQTAPGKWTYSATLPGMTEPIAEGRSASEVRKKMIKVQELIDVLLKKKSVEFLDNHEKWEKFPWAEDDPQEKDAPEDEKAEKLIEDILAFATRSSDERIQEHAQRCVLELRVNRRKYATHKDYVKRLKEILRELKAGGRWSPSR